MMRTSKIAGAALAVLLVGGCSAGPQEGEEPRQEAVESTERAGPEADISAEEGHTVYLYAQQSFSPELVRWEVSEDMTELHYSRLNCLGSVTAEGFATLEPRDDPDAWEATWVTPNPIKGTQSSFYRLSIDGQSLGAQHSRQDVATTFHDMVLRDYTDMCTRTGKGVARFVLP